MKALHVIAWVLLVIGGLNWLLVGLGGEAWNVVGLLGDGVARIIYVLVGISAIISIFSHKKECKTCVPSSSASVQTM